MASFTDRFRSKSSKTTNHFLIHKSFFFYKEFIRVLFNYHSTSIDRYHLYNKISVKILFIISCIFVYLDRLRVTFSYSYTHTRTFNHEYNSCMCAFTWACRNRMIYRLTCPNELSVHFYHRFSSIAGPPPNRLYPIPYSGTVGKKWLISTGIVISRGTRNAQR